MGGGLAGLLCGLQLQKHGLRVPLSRVVKARCISHPVRWISEPSARWSTRGRHSQWTGIFRQQAPAHPYSLLGPQRVLDLLARRRH